MRSTRRIISLPKFGFFTQAQKLITSSMRHWDGLPCYVLRQSSHGMHPYYLEKTERPQEPSPTHSSAPFHQVCVLFSCHLLFWILCMDLLVGSRFLVWSTRCLFCVGICLKFSLEPSTRARDRPKWSSLSSNSNSINSLSIVSWARTPNLGSCRARARASIQHKRADLE
jgi:hypothetical protein